MAVSVHSPAISTAQNGAGVVLSSLLSCLCPGGASRAQVPVPRPVPWISPCRARLGDDGSAADGPLVGAEYIGIVDAAVVVILPPSTFLISEVAAGADLQRDHRALRSGAAAGLPAREHHVPVAGVSDHISEGDLEVQLAREDLLVQGGDTACTADDAADGVIELHERIVCPVGAERRDITVVQRVVERLERGLRPLGRRAA